MQFFPDGRARPLTSAEASASAPALSHDGNRLAFLRADAGKQSQLHVLELAGGGEARKVTDLPMGALEMRWLPDGAHMIVVAHVLGEDLTLEGTRALVAKRDKAGTVPHVTEDRIYRYWDRWLTGGEVPDLFVLDMATGALRDLTPDARRWFELMDPGGQFDISPDGREVVSSADVSTPPHARGRFALFTVPVAGGAPTCITPDHAADAVRPRYSPDGAALDRREPLRRQAGPSGSFRSRLWRSLATEGMPECCPDVLQASPARRRPTARYGQRTFMADQEPA